MAQHTIKEIELPNGDVCTLKDAESAEKIQSLMEVLEDFAKMRTLWSDIEDSEGNVITDSNSGSIRGRFLFEQL